MGWLPVIEAWWTSVVLCPAQHAPNMQARITVTCLPCLRSSDIVVDRKSAVDMTTFVPNLPPAEHGSEITHTHHGAATTAVYSVEFRDFATPRRAFCRVQFASRLRSKTEASTHSAAADLRWADREFLAMHYVPVMAENRTLWRLTSTRVDTDS